MYRALWITFLLIPLFFSNCATYKPFSSDQHIKSILSQDTFVRGIIDSFEAYEAQIIYTQIHRDQNNIPHFKSFYWNHQPGYYFYPASMVKMPAALAAAEKVNVLSKEHPGLTLFSPLRIDSVRPPQTPVIDDLTAQNTQASVAQYIKKIFVVSDNDAYNRLYEFVGQNALNTRLHELGYKQTHIITRLDAPLFNFESNKYTNPITFAEEDLLLYRQSEQYNNADPRVAGLKSLQKGKGFISADSLVMGPFDFSTKNYFSLKDMSDMIRSILFPASIDASLRWKLTKEQLSYIRSCMMTLPKESKYPLYDSSHYDGYCKFFMYGDQKTDMPDHIRIFNKVGWAYGYLTDAAYIVDFKNKTEFILTATINTNTDGIYNDGVYAYQTIGLPFLSRIGRLIYEFELKRKKAFLPDLSEFKLKPQS